MSRPLYGYRYVDGPPALLERKLLDGLLAQLAKGQGPPAADGSYEIDLPADLAGVTLEKQVRIRTGAVRHADSRAVLPVRWHADPGALAFPTFEGTIELSPLHDRMAQLTIAGSYGFPLGGVADAAMLHGVAEGTIGWLLDELAARLEEPDASPAPAAAGPRSAALRVADVMSRNPLVLHPEMPAKTAALMLYHAEVSGAPVVGMDGALVGVLSEQDLLAREASRRWVWGREAAREAVQREAMTVAEACSRPARTTVPESTLADAAREMLDRRVNRLVVLDRSRVAGMVTRHDVLAALIRDDAEVQAIVSQLIAEQGHDHVNATVDWGEVTLAGTIELCSAASRLAASVAAIEGVTRVDTSELECRHDDVLPNMPLPFS